MPVITGIVLIAGWLLPEPSAAAVFPFSPAEPVATPSPAETATAAAGALLTLLAVGAGIGVAVSLLLVAGAAIALRLVFRKRRHQETAARISEHDVTERRVAELYAAAAEQLGHHTPPVRLAGLYALERLAQENPGHRQTIVNVICAYLRMPCGPPSPGDQGEPEPPGGPASRPAGSLAESEGEHQVRRIAQRILLTHLNPGKEGWFWPDTDLDLTGAHLDAWDMSRRQCRNADFTGATFLGKAGFGGARFTEDATFTEACFTGFTDFTWAAFAGYAGFKRAGFQGVWFDGATFSGVAEFSMADFAGVAEFNGVRLAGSTRFSGASFAVDTDFDRVVLPENFYVMSPPGWRVARDPDGTRRLARQEPEAGGPPGE
ncbi:pentapeptide repeat-containing protein [Rhizohabitans arisaemae]|uniref:pentapeptide repeat-containing protein n=1 Tax=Rhizohabitans arisaemae TaxID=2720610 RepID=UPI0024B15605|nr:pentapeptide repeat-containing protein [Rhizohabitans arisaemae]